jgi:hypothetical protein
MAWLDSFKTFINNLDEKQFRLYLGGFIGAVVLGIILGITLFYRDVASYKKQIDKLNEQREEIKTILQKNYRVEQQRTKINQLLTEKKFKIGGVFEELLKRLQLTNNIESSKTLPSEKDSEYRETSLEAHLVNITMQQLCTLLNELHTNKLIYTKEIDITKSERVPRTINVTLTIATLERILEPEATE